MNMLNKEIISSFIFIKIYIIRIYIICIFILDKNIIFFKLSILMYGEFSRTKTFLKHLLFYKPNIACTYKFLVCSLVFSIIEILFYFSARMCVCVCVCVCVSFLVY